METPGIEKRSECLRCGTCCKNGGPSLHGSDLESIKQGVVSLVDLYTIRPGELIRNNIDGGLFYTETEIIKIAADPKSPACRLYDSDNSACTIYENRPAQCRAMKCWDTSDIVSLFERGRITRKDIFSNIPWLLEMIETHEAACRYADIRSLAEQRGAGDQSAGKALSGMLAYDDSVRGVMVEKAGIEPEMLSLLFGRPLSETLQHQFGIKVNRP